MPHVQRLPHPWPQIQNESLSENDIGRRVTYTAPHGAIEHGVLSSFEPNGRIWVRFKGPQGELCPSNTLSWSN